MGSASEGAIYITVRKCPLGEKNVSVIFPSLRTILFLCEKFGRLCLGNCYNKRISYNQLEVFIRCCRFAPRDHRVWL